MADIEFVALWVDVSPSIAEKTFCRDAADDKFIHAALAAGALLWCRNSNRRSIRNHASSWRHSWELLAAQAESCETLKRMIISNSQNPKWQPTSFQNWRV